MTTVAWVAGSTQVTISSGTTISASTPAGIADGDLLLAAVFARSAITTLSGWTLLDSTADFTSGSNNQHISLFKKTTVTSADASTSFTWTQASSGRAGVLYAVARDADSTTISTDTVDSADTFLVSPPVQTADGEGQLLVLFGSTINTWDAAVAPTAPAGATLFSGGASAGYRLAGAYQARNTGEANSGSFNMNPGDPPPDPQTNGLGAITVRIAPAAPSTASALIALDGPLGAPALLATHRPGVRVACPSPLGAMSAFVWHDFSGQVDGQTPRYRMTLTTPDGDVVAPISSWQATLQTLGACYVQCVVPAAEPYVDAITAATEFTIERIAVIAGQTFAYEMASATLETAQMAQGPNRYTALLSGHSTAFAVDDGLPDSLNRDLVDVRSVFAEPRGLRVRCAVDWLLRPGMRAVLSGAPFVVGSINYYVADNDQYIDVNEAEAGA